MKIQTAERIGLAVGAVFLQVFFFHHLSIFGVQPDIVLIFLLWYMTKSTRTAAILMAAFLGFSQDALLDLWGLNMFAKTLLAFIIQPWISENMGNRKELLRVLSVVFIVSLFHNLIFLLLSSVIKNYSAELLFWRHWIGNAAYTAILAGIIQLFRSREMVLIK
jgi:rod shape-determining protein MreD